MSECDSFVRELGGEKKEGRKIRKNSLTKEIPYFPQLWRIFLSFFATEDLFFSILQTSHTATYKKWEKEIRKWVENYLN